MARLTRFKLGLYVGRKIKVYQGTKSLVMLATGSQTKAQLNVYLSITEQELLATHRQTARRLPRLSDYVGQSDLNANCVWRYLLVRRLEKMP